MTSISALSNHSLISVTNQSSTRGRNIYHQDAVKITVRIKKLHHGSHSQRLQVREQRWRASFALDTGGASNAGNQDNSDSDNTGLGRTRLGIIVRAASRQLLEKLNEARKNFPMKIFLLLLGFYTANALATILGQTGDWDV